jgi:hypothetical protein
MTIKTTIDSFNSFFCKIKIISNYFYSVINISSGGVRAKINKETKFNPLCAIPSILFVNNLIYIAFGLFGR